MTEEIKNEVAEIQVEAPASAVEAKLDNTSVANMTLASQVFALKTQALDLGKALEQATAQNVEASKVIENLKAELEKSAKDFLAKDAELKKVEESVKGFEATITDLQATVKKQDQIIDAKEIKQITNGTDPVSVPLASETKTVLQAYKGLKGQARYDFFKANEKQILKEIEGQ